MEISFSNHSLAASFSLPSQEDILENSNSNSNNNRNSNQPKRTASLIRPERLRIDHQHPQYHTSRKRLTNNEDFYRQAGDRSAPARRSVIRRGLLGREGDERQQYLSEENRLNIDNPTNNEQEPKSFDFWKAFCYLVTCCCPSPILKSLGTIFVSF